MTRLWLLALAVSAGLPALRCAWADGPPTVEEARAAMRLADPSLTIELVAAEPEVVSPVAFAWDEFGRLYVAEMTDYPTATTGGRVKRLEDRDGDGRYEHATVFADKLPFPSGVLPWNGGLLVTAAPDLLFLKDTDGDGRADAWRVVLTGFAEGNQQLRVNSPVWGMDNRVYLANGRSGGAVRRPEDPPGKAVPVPRNDLRVDPATGAFEPVAGFSQFGLPRDDWGDRFPSWNTVPWRHVVLELPAHGGGPLAGPTETVAEVLDPADGGRVYSLAPAQRRFNAETVAFFNATCGPTIDRGGLPGVSYGGHAFVCEPLTGVVHRRRLDPLGPTYVARRVEQGREFLASTHPWFRPVNLGNGPDGALYVADFCRAWVEHPDFVPESQRGTVDFREGHERGRIWRIRPKSSVHRGVTRLPGRAGTGDLVALLGHPNGWFRDTAQRLLVERGEAAAVAPLRTLARSSPAPLARVHALWTLQGLNALDPETLRTAFRADAPRVREQAVRLVGRSASDHLEALGTLADDPDERVRLRVAVALAGVDTDAARDALARVAACDAGSRWAEAAVLDGAARNPARFLRTVSTRQPAWFTAPSRVQAQFFDRLAAEVGAGNVGPDVDRLVDKAVGAGSEAAAFAMLGGLARGQSIARAQRPFAEGPEAERVGRVLTSAAVAARDETRPPWVRGHALELLLAARPAVARELLPDLLAVEQPVELQRAAARGVAKAADPALVTSLCERWDRYTVGTRRLLLASFSASVPVAGRLLDAVGQGRISAGEVDTARREAIRGLGDAAFQARVHALLSAPPDADRREVVRRYQPALHLRADVGRGRALFQRNCQSCHARHGQGAKVGPDLASVAGRPKDELLVAVLDPSREAAPDGLGVVVTTTRGQTVAGILTEETPYAIRLRRAEGVEEVIPRGDVEAVRPTGRSFMPDGLEQVLSPQDLADLIALMQSPAP